MKIKILLCRLTSVTVKRPKKSTQPSFVVIFSFTSSVLSHTFRFIFRVSYLQDIAFIVRTFFFFFFSLAEPNNEFLRYMSVQFRGFSLQSVDSPISYIYTCTYMHTQIHTHIYACMHTFKASQMEVCLRDPYLKITYSHIDWYWFVFHYTHTLTNTTEFADSLYYTACA